MSLKTFRLGGCAGYSIRAVGHAPQCKGDKPAYTHVQLYQEIETGDYMLAEWMLIPENYSAIREYISALGDDVDAKDERYLRDLFAQAWNNRSLS